NLDQQTIRFIPVPGATPRYRFELSGASYDEAAANLGGPSSTLGDDDSTVVTTLFPFPYYGRIYTQIFLNSDANLTFGAADKETSDRTLGRFSAGPPRVAPLFSDLDPSRNPQGVRILSEAGRLVISWAGVPEYQDFGTGAAQTFQVRLYPDGRIEFAYSGISTSGAVVGISPGDLAPNTLVSFAAGSIEQYATGIAERFGGREEIDTVTAAQRFYESHEDAYDYLVFYNTLGIGASPGAVAWEADVRNIRLGIGSPVVDYGRQYGSPSRLQAIMNMGPVAQYPTDPNAVVSARALSRDTPLSLLGHEAGHLFLAYASVRDPFNPNARPLLGFQGAHWTFTFNSEASLLEGNRIRDDGPDASPRFLTTATVEGYAPLDQYLMGFRAPSEVPPTFLVTGAGTQFSSRIPQSNVSFNGSRQDISVENIIAAEGRRTPDHTVAQRRFRFAFVLIVPAGAAPRQADVDQVESYRREFEAYYSRAASGRATSGTTLRLAMRLSSFPASGVLVGGQSTATVSIEKAAVSPLTVLLKTATGAASVPSSATIAAGATTASFPIT
ncbi:MAG: hypothetical protein ABIZ80_21595, partial [Bryobacteraceae bacterium]